jgi:CHAT domain-containing protein
MTKAGFKVAWEAGAGAQIEIFSPGLEADAYAYRLKFTPPMRRTIRPPMMELTLGAGELGPIRQRLDRLVGVVDARRGGEPADARDRDDVLDQTRVVGEMLFSLIFPDDVQLELSAAELFLEIGMDEPLLEYPWELLHDGEEFLCLKHSMGRFVNVTKPTIPNFTKPSAAGKGILSVLVISVPRPMPRADGTPYSPLPAAASETRAILSTLTDLGDAARVTLLNGPEATFEAVYNALKGPEHFHIVHFNGHASFNNENPYKSCLALYDIDMTTNPVLKFFGKKPPVLFFMNACETAKAGASSNWRDRYDVFGLARAFLDTGANLLGNRWEVGDVGAAAFATTFYAKLADGFPLGTAIRDARRACLKSTTPADFSWASYAFYGDPRLCFRKLSQQ